LNRRGDDYVLEHSRKESRRSNGKKMTSTTVPVEVLSLKLRRRKSCGEDAGSKVTAGLGKTVGPPDTR